MWLCFCSSDITTYCLLRSSQLRGVCTVCTVKLFLCVALRHRHVIAVRVQTKRRTRLFAQRDFASLQVRTEPTSRVPLPTRLVSSRLVSTLYLCSVYFDLFPYLCASQLVSNRFFSCIDFAAYHYVKLVGCCSVFGPD